MKAIVDCNSFYCSCEKVFRPDLVDKPVVVLSNNDGCIIAMDDHAKKLGFNMTGPYFMAKDKLQEQKVEVFSSNYYLYGDMSRRVMDILKLQAGVENVETYSVDEAFVTLDSISDQQLLSFASAARETILQWTGVQVSVGIAPTKTLSKLANKIAKKNKERTGCILLLNEEAAINHALKQTDVGSLWGVGKKYADKLHAFGIHSAFDLKNTSGEFARKHLGGVVGVRLIKELNGEEAIVMKDELVSKKMIATTRMFGRAVSELKDIREAVATYASRAGEKLRRQHSAASILTVFLVAHDRIKDRGFNPGPTLSNYIVLPQPTSLTPLLIKPAVQLAEKLFQKGRRYTKAGVILSGLVPDTSIQSNLFQQQTSANRFLMEMVDNINVSMRNDIIRFASAGDKQKWKMRQDFHSPRYTTRWGEIPLVG